MGIFDFFNQQPKPVQKEKSKSTPKRRILKKFYDGASKSDRLDKWYSPTLDANSITARDLPTLRNRARELRRNNEIAASALNAITSDVVGRGIKTQFRSANETVTLDPRLESNWKAWTRSRQFDYDQKHNLFSFQRLIMDAVTESGECLLLRKIDRTLDFPLSYQILESDFIDSTRDGYKAKNGNKIIQGIEYDQKGRRVAYYLYTEHPGGYYGGFTLGTISTESIRVPAKDVLHIYKTLRPGQARGIPWLAPVMVRIHDAGQYEDAELVKQKIAAMLTAFVRDINAEFRDEDETCGEDLGATLQPGLIEELPPGKTIEFTDPPSVEHYPAFMTKVKQSIAAGMGISYEALTNDLSNVNFSSARMGELRMRRNIDMWREEVINFQFLDIVAQDFLNYMALTTDVNIENATWVHTPPKREMIDPVKETAALKEQLRLGITTLSDEIMAQGRDPEDHLNKIKEDNEKLDELGIVLDSDPRKTQNSGKIQDMASDTENNEGENENEENSQD